MGGAGIDPFYRTVDNSDIPMMNLALQKDFKVSNYGMTPDQLRDQRVEMQILDQLYNKWAEEDSSLQGINSNKHTAAKNKEFRNKLEAWKARSLQRKGAKKTVTDHEKALREFFTELVGGYKKHLQVANACVHKFDEFTDNMKADRKFLKVIMNFLSEMPNASVLQLDDLDRQLKNYQVSQQQKMDKIEDFATSIKTDLPMDSHYFSFFEIPGHVANRNYSRQDYE